MPARGMTDIHCHILHGMDDGPVSLDQALDMCRMAAADGIKTIVATPHFRPGAYELTEQSVMDAVNMLETAAKGEGLDLRILPGAEVAVFAEMDSYLEKARYLTLNNNGRYFLAELPPLSVPPNWDKFLLSLIPRGLTPVISHPERNYWFLNHPDELASAVGKGLLVQVTAMSITGALGNDARDFGCYLLRKGLVHAISSDAHSPQFRRPVLSEAYRVAADLVGRKKAEDLVTAFPEAMIEGRDMPVPETAIHPHQGTKKRRWFKRLFRSDDG